AGGDAFVLQPAAAVRAALAHRHALDAVGRRRAHTATSVAAMAGASPAEPGRGGEWGAGLDRDFRRRGGRTEGPFAGGAFLVTQPVFEPGVFLAQPINLLLLLQALRTVSEPVGLRW